MRYEAAIFDLDGTLLDTLEDIAYSANFALRSCGKEPIELERYKFLVGEGAKRLMSEALGEEKDEELAKKLLEAFKSDYALRWKKNSKPYEGIEEMLKSLNKNGFKMAVLSNKPEEFVKECVRYFFDEEMFEYIGGEHDRFPRKPDPSGAYEALKYLKVDPDRVCFIGDTKIDMLTAKNSNLDGFGVSWGFRSKEELLNHGAKKVFDTALELEEYLLSNNH
jgi:phosphoglycolate phosphatase